MANHKQAKKRARQSVGREQRNVAVRTRIRTRVRALRYAVEQFRTLGAGKHIHPQEVEKHLRWLTESKATDLASAGFGDVIDTAKALLVKYEAGSHQTMLRRLARADLRESGRLLGAAASKGVIPKRTASRRISRLTIMVNTIDVAA